MSEWQPIETAPRDGTTIMIRHSDGQHPDKTAYWIEPGPDNGVRNAHWTSKEGGIMLPLRPDLWKLLDR